MYSIVSNGNRVAYGVKKIICDSKDELDLIIKYIDLAPGSKVYCTQDQQVFILTATREWQDATNISGLNEFNIPDTNLLEF